MISYKKEGELISSCIEVRAWLSDDEVMIYDLNSINLHHGILESYMYKLMPFTTILDKNSKKIWLHDILLSKDEKGKDYYSLVTFKDGCFMCESLSETNKKMEEFLFYVAPFVEVIGNIHEHQNLLSN